MKVLLFLLLPITAFAKFEATTTVQVHPGMIAINPTANPGTLLTKNYMENEFETVVAPTTLRAALLSLQPDNAKKKPIPDEAVEKLRQKISAQPRRGTDFIEITATADTKKGALRLSNAVAEAYMNRRLETEKARATKALKALDAELLAQSEFVAEYRKELTHLIQKHGIPYFENDRGIPVGKTAGNMLQNARERLDQFEVKRDQLELQTKKLTELSDQELMTYAAGLDLPENKVSGHQKKFQEARNKKLALLEKGLELKHPEVLALDTEATKHKTNAQKELVSLKDKLNTKLALTNRQIERMNEMLKNKKKETIELSLIQSQYHQAKEDYEQSRAMLREMKIKQQEARVLLKLPRDPVTLHERAK